MLFISVDVCRHVVSQCKCGDALLRESTLTKNTITLQHNKLLTVICFSVNFIYVIDNSIYRKFIVKQNIIHTSVSFW